MRIDADRLKSLRKGRGLTRADLAKRSGVATRTVQRLENEPQHCQKTREDTVNRLAKALGVEAGVLTGELPMPEPGGQPAPAPERVPIGAQISPKARLAYDLVRRRYGVSATEIINMAPLFFTLLAEGSLARRRREVEEGSDQLHQIDSGHGVFIDALTVADMAVAEEEESISKADLFGENLGGNGVGSPVFDPSENNPFASYLRSLAVPGVVDVDSGELTLASQFRFPDYHICPDELDGIANGSTNARWALETGYARLSEIPEELQEEKAGEERAKWLEDRLPEVYRKLLEGEGGDTIPQSVATDPSGELREILDKAAVKESGTSTKSGGDDQ